MSGDTRQRRDEVSKARRMQERYVLTVWVNHFALKQLLSPETKREQIGKVQMDTGLLSIVGDGVGKTEMKEPLQMLEIFSVNYGKK